MYDELRVELCVGQYLDLAGDRVGHARSGAARRIEWYKSGKYTVERPLHLGAALAGRLDDLPAPLSAFGLPLGEAFQMRDDLLGVFGDPALTGKPVGDDLREGKLTPLVAATAVRADADGRALLDRIGAPDIAATQIAALQQPDGRLRRGAEVEAAIEALVGREPRGARRRADHRGRPDGARRARQLRRVARPVTRPDERHRRRDPRAREALRRRGAGRRHRSHDRRGRDLRAARTQRRGEDHDGRDPRGLPPRRCGSVRVLGGDPHTDAARLRTQVGVMLQEGGLYPGLRPLELLRLYAAFYDDADDPERLLDVVGLRDVAGTSDPAPVGRSGTTAVARRRADRPAAPRCSSTSRPPGWTRAPRRHVGTRAGPRAGWDHGRADDALHGRGRTALRPARDPRPRSRRRPRDPAEVAADAVEPCTR